jgi:hypothetical protein
MEDKKIIRVNPNDGEWIFLEKNQDASCVIKNTKTNEELNCRIKSISSNGSYKLEVLSSKTQ